MTKKSYEKKMLLYELSKRKLADIESLALNFFITEKWSSWDYVGSRFEFGVYEKNSIQD